MKYLIPNAIVFLDTTDRDEVLHTLVDKLGKAKKIKDTNAFFEAILAREKIISTGIGMGVAIPHAKLSGYKNFFIAIGIQKTAGIPWNSLDGAPVRLVFLIGGPDNQQNEYLQILSSLTNAIKQEELRQKLLLTQTPEEVISLFNHV